MSRRVSKLSSVGASMFSDGLGGASSQDQFSARRLEEQQAHHKRLLQKRLNQKRRGTNKASDDGESTDPDHPDNVRKRELERQRQQKIAAKRLELKRREQRKKLELRKAHRKLAKNQESFTVVKDGRIQRGELSAEERKARLKAKAELQRRKRREEREANHNPFDPRSKTLTSKTSDIWDSADADAIMANASMLHEISTASRVHRRTVSGDDADGGFDDFDDLYAFDEVDDILNDLEQSHSPSKKQVSRPRSNSPPLKLERQPEDPSPTSSDDAQKPGTPADKPSVSQQSSIEVGDINDLLDEIM